MVRDLIGAETAEHMYIFCVNHGLLKDHSAAYLYDAVCKLLKANEENLESTGFDYEEDSLDSYAAQDHTPVSYTHLDVYKRQQHWKMKHFRHT